MLFSHVAFTFPWLLGFLATLPVLWWLLRLTPPAPKKIQLPTLSLLQDLVTPEQLPAHTPWWLLALRLFITILIIIAFAQPTLNPKISIAKKDTLLLVIDNDWASARNWNLRQKALHDIIDQAEQDNRSVILLPTTPPSNGDTLQLIGPMAAKAALAEAQNIRPLPWASDWLEARKLLSKLDEPLESLWLASGSGGVDTKIFYSALQDKGHVRVLADTETPLYVLQPPEAGEDGVVLPVLRAQTENTAAISINALARDGHALAHIPLTFSAGSPRAAVPLHLPFDVRNQITRFDVDDQQSAATTVVMDASWVHRAVGLVGDPSELAQHSLLNGKFYIDRALKPFADIHVDQLDALLKQNMAVLILTDTAELNEDQITNLKTWVKNGGVLVRFAGEKIATQQNPKETELLPVILRTGDRAMGGALSWATPQHLQTFPTFSPFQGLNIPSDVTVSRQVLAEPSSDLSSHSWASLADGTPLVTSKNVGSGLSILFHIAPRSDWSNLYLSGLFVEMLQRIINLSHDTAHETNYASLQPLRLLNGFGEAQKPTTTAQALSDNDFTHTPLGPHHPPGLYGTDLSNRAFNFGAVIGQPETLKDIPTETYNQHHKDKNLQPILLAFSFILLILDFILSLWLRGLFLSYRKSPAALFFLAIMLSAPAVSAAPNSDSKNAVELTAKTTLAYIETGDRQTDHTSESGLLGLARLLQQRTSIDEVSVAGVDPNSDELAFFPLLYWPIIVGEVPLSPQGAKRVNDYLHHGGMILLDTMTGETPSPELLKRTLSNIDIPSLSPLPQDHVLKRSFYLLDEFPGRYANTDFWLEPEDASSYDGVATVLSGSNGWAAAWAIDESGHPLFPCTPNGEIQREHAYRFGINIVMYALTGNYKSDQLHAQELLKRIGK